MSYQQVKAWRQKNRAFYNFKCKMRRRLKRSRWYWLAASKADPQTDAYKHR